MHWKLPNPKWLGLLRPHPEKWVDATCRQSIVSSQPRRKHICQRGYAERDICRAKWMGIHRFTEYIYVYLALGACRRRGERKERTATPTRLIKSVVVQLSLIILQRSFCVHPSLLPSASPQSCQQQVKKDERMAAIALLLIWSAAVAVVHALVPHELGPRDCAANNCVRGMWKMDTSQLSTGANNGVTDYLSK